MRNAVRDQLVVDRLGTLQEIARRELGMAQALPTITYRLRGYSAGQAIYESRTINLNPILLKGNAEHFIENTVAHEFAHIIVHDMNGLLVFQHGREWQDLMKMFGVAPNITHDYDVSHVAPTFSWECGCSTHQVSKKVHRELVAGTIYDCNRCGQDINRYKTTA